MNVLWPVVIDGRPDRAERPRTACIRRGFAERLKVGISRIGSRIVRVEVDALRICLPDFDDSSRNRAAVYIE
jgi:hypothetical protein